MGWNIYILLKMPSWTKKSNILNPGPTFFDSCFPQVITDPLELAQTNSQLV